MKTGIVVVTAALFSIVISGCTSDEPVAADPPPPPSDQDAPSQPADPPPPAPAPPVSSTPQIRTTGPVHTFTDADVLGHNDVDADFEIDGPAPVWDDQARTDALQLATDTMEAFARPGLDYDTWWRGFAPHLTLDAQRTYVAVDPANIPVSAITGDPQLGEPKSVYLATVVVPTDVGEFGVLMSRIEQGDPWLVDRLEFPEGVG